MATKEYYAAHREELKAKQRAYYAANRERCIAYVVSYQKRHPEVKAAADRLYHERHRDDILPKQRAYYDANSERVAEKRREWRERNPEKMAESQRAWAARNADHVKAHRILNYAVQRGKLVRPSACQECQRECVPHGHHEDYSKPLEVKWMCTDCHKRLHRKPRARVVRFVGADD